MALDDVVLGPDDEPMSRPRDEDEGEGREDSGEASEDTYSDPDSGAEAGSELEGIESW